jgi:hypothetical protein
MRAEIIESQWQLKPPRSWAASIGPRPHGPFIRLVERRLELVVGQWALMAALADAQTDPFLSADKQDKRSVVPIAVADVDQWLGGFKTCWPDRKLSPRLMAPTPAAHEQR